MCSLERGGFGMGNDHEYALVGGVNRATIGRWVAVAAASVSAVLVFVLLSLVDVAEKFGVSANLPPSLFSLAGASAVYGALYLLFSRFIWKWGPISRLMKVPNLEGCWQCIGESSFNEEGVGWEASVVISQNWDKLCIVMETSKSRSESVSAALISEGVGTFRLLYHYKNDPREFEEGLNAHHGCVDLLIAHDLQSGDGIYFTGRGRTTFGRMIWSRK